MLKPLLLGVLSLGSRVAVAGAAVLLSPALAQAQDPPEIPTFQGGPRGRMTVTPIVEDGELVAVKIEWPDVHKKATHTVSPKKDVWEHQFVCDPGPVHHIKVTRIWEKVDPVKGNGAGFANGAVVLVIVEAPTECRVETSHRVTRTICVSVFKDKLKGKRQDFELIDPPGKVDGDNNPRDKTPILDGGNFKPDPTGFVDKNANLPMGKGQRWRVWADEPHLTKKPTSADPALNLQTENLVIYTFSWEMWVQIECDCPPGDNGEERHTGGSVVTTHTHTTRHVTTTNGGRSFGTPLVTGDGVDLDSSGTKVAAPDDETIEIAKSNSGGTWSKAASAVTEVLRRVGILPKPK